MQAVRTNNLRDITGCIEDRTFGGAEDGELNQLPGADIFFSALNDVLAVDKHGSPTHSTLLETVLDDVKRLGQSYSVHNDDSHGDEFDGCGFAAQIKDIFVDLSNNIDEIIGGLGKLTNEQKVRARELAAAAGRLPAGYFVTVGGRLVHEAADAGAYLITYAGEHTAKTLTVDESSSSTYDSAQANAGDNDLEPSFNVDTNRARDRAETFEVDPADDAQLFAELASLATVRVLSGGKITSADYAQSAQPLDTEPIVA